MKQLLTRRALVGSSLAAVALPGRLPARTPESRSEPDCVFCQIVAGSREAAVVWRDEVAVVFGSHAPIQPGHLLVAPRSHARDLFALDEAVAAHLLPLAARVGRALTAAVAADGLTLLQNNGAASGQSILHFHLHLIPRHRGREIFQRVVDTPKATPAELEAVLGPVRRALEPGR